MKTELREVKSLTPTKQREKWADDVKLRKIVTYGQRERERERERESRQIK